MASTTAFILARAGSKGLPGKNTTLFKGRPLIAHTIQHALDCTDIDNVIVSTDGREIALAAMAAGARVMWRSAELASDTALPKDAMRVHLAEMEAAGQVPDIVALLQPTSPLRQPIDITRCVSCVRDDGFDSAATFMESPSSPYRAWVDTSDGPAPFIDSFDPWQPRQSLPMTYCLNGAVYVARRDAFLADPTNSFLPGRAKMVLMPRERSIDIDILLDLRIADVVAEDLDRQARIVI